MISSFLILLVWMQIGSSMAQTSHTVVVGLEGSFFNPPTVSAGRGDIITFVFAGEIHTVTQSSFESPCAPLPGGFSSGLAGRARNSSSALQTWDLRVTDVSAPIWFYCLANRPVFHCSAGMVGVKSLPPHLSVWKIRITDKIPNRAINPPSQESYSQFLNVAKAVSASPSAPFTPVLTGIGAFATNTPAAPTPPPSTTTPFPSSNGTASQSSPHTPEESTSALISPTAPSSTNQPSSKNVTIIVAGAVGAGLLVLFILGTMYLCFRHQRLSQRRYIAELSSRLDKQRELEARPYHIESRDGRSSIQSERLHRSTMSMKDLTAPTTSTRLHPLRRRATEAGNSTSSIDTFNLVTPFTVSEDIQDASRFSDHLLVPPLPMTAKTAVTTKHHSRAERGSDISSFVLPSDGDRGSTITDSNGRQRYLFVNNPAPSSRPSSNQVTPEQYWSAHISRGASSSQQSQYPFGYSTSPPNYLAATGGTGQAS